MGQPSRPAMVTPWGKCLASVKTTIPKETEPAVARGKRRAASDTTGDQMNIKQAPCLARIVAPGYPENQWIVSVIRRGQPAYDTLPGGRITECLPDSWICESLMASPFRSIGSKWTNRYASIEDRYLHPLPGIEDPTQIDERVPESEVA